jgi:hypothetical protein
MIAAQQRSGLTLLSWTCAVEGQRRTVVCQDRHPLPNLTEGGSSDDWVAHSITSSARALSASGNVIPRAATLFRLIAK